MQTRHRCPACKHRTRSFVRYIYTDTGEAIAPHVGRCSREDKCGYHLKPREYFGKDHTLKKDHRPWLRDHRKDNRPCTIDRRKDHRPWTIDHGGKKEATIDYRLWSMVAHHTIDSSWVNASFTAYRNNNFVQYLIKRFGFDVADQLVGRYRIGTSSHWPGATVFWQLDANCVARTGKIMLYHAETGKRVKEPFNHITWVHTVLNKRRGARTDEAVMLYPPKDFKLQQCFFGEHLLKEHSDKPVAICESEKTAVIASAILPSFIWLACGSLQGLNPAKCQVLQGRQVMLFPDCNAYTKWVTKARMLQTLMPGTTITVSQTLENIATPTDRLAGIDLADVLCR